MAWNKHSSFVKSYYHGEDLLPDEIARAGSGCGLLGRWSERALVLLTECIDSGVIVGGGGPASLGSRLSTDGLQTGAAQIFFLKFKKLKSFWLHQLIN